MVSNGKCRLHLNEMQPAFFFKSSGISGSISLTLIYMEPVFTSTGISVRKHRGQRS